MCKALSAVRPGSQIMSSPSGVAAIQGISVGQERKLLQLPRKFEAGSHLRPDGTPFCPHTFFVKAGGQWMTAAQLTLTFRQGQRLKTRHNKARKARKARRRGARAPDAVTHVDRDTITPRPVDASKGGTDARPSRPKRRRTAVVRYGM